MDLTRKKQIIFLIGITLNALGNAFMFKASIASPAWGLAAMNMSNAFHITEGMAVALCGTLVFCVSRILEKKIPSILNWLGLIFSYFFSFFIDIFKKILEGLPNSDILNVVYTIIGITLIAYAVGIYMKANYILLPIDEGLGIASNKLFKGNFTKGGYLFFGIAIGIATISGIIGDKFIGFTIATVIIYFCFSPMIDFFSKNSKYIDKFLEIV